MKKLLFMGIVLAFSGCATTQQGNDKGHEIARFVVERSGYIEDAVAILVRSAVNFSEEGSDKQHIIDMAHAVAQNVNECLESGRVDAGSIREAFQINEEHYDKIFESVGSIVSLEIEHLKSNGYADAAISILRAASKGIADGTAK